jgi:dienelactone hydrolase
MPMTESVERPVEQRLVRVSTELVTLEGDLSLPNEAHAIVLFAHGSGSSRHSSRNRHVARLFNEAKLATILLDLLTPDEEAIDMRTAQLRFDVGLLAERLVGTTDWLTQYPETRHVPIGYFGASTGGRPDLAAPALPHVRAPTLLVVGGNDIQVIQLNRAALAQLRCEKQLVIVPGATHLFEEPGALDAVARLARDWFHRHLIPAAQRTAAAVR